MKKTLLVCIMNLVLSVITLCSPKYVFMFIGDGLGSSQRQISEYYMNKVDKVDGKLVMNQFPIAGINTTHSLDTLITDSAAAGTALATGYKTNNGMISQLPNGKDLKNLAEYAREKNMKTGLISSTRLTHATPAVFASNNSSRNNENDIALDFVDANIDFFAGGGYRNFISSSKKNSKRKDNTDVVKLFKDKGYHTYIGEDSSRSFNGLIPSKHTKVFAAFTPSHMPYEIDRVNSKPNLPSLADITEKGIETLSKGDNGFFMMVEGGRIDHAAHAQDAASVIHDTLAFDRAVSKAYDFYKKNPNDTLILVVGDHETGGVGMGYGKNYFLNLESLKNIKVSIDDNLQKQYKGDRSSYFKYISKNLGLNNLSVDEKRSIIEAMDIEDTKIRDNNYGGYTPTAISVAHILAKRANIMFTTFAHTGTQIPLSAIGSSSHDFGGFIDNTAIANRLIEIIEKR